MGDRRKPNDEWEFMLDPEKRIGYIRMTAFSRDTAADLKKALDELVSRKMRGLILDLRFNPGGLLTSAVDVADLFLTDGKIVSTKGRSIPERTWDAKKEGTFEGFPMVVLVNRYMPVPVKSSQRRCKIITARSSSASEPGVREACKT